MTNLTTRSDNLPAVPPVRPQPRCAVSVRVAVEGDFAFIDALQKMHSHMVGFLPRKDIEKYIAGGNVLIAEGDNCGQSSPLGYCIFKDEYLKREEVGIIYQLNVLPLKQRNLIGATLVKSALDRAAYGCKLFCCWCAQDIRANYFWEALGFVPLAFRTGSRAKQRIHIFWQRRIRENDEGPGATPYWFPSKTDKGAVGEDRIVLPIPLDTHWLEAKPLVLPGLPAVEHGQDARATLLPGGQPVRARPEQPKLTAAQRVAIQRTQNKHLGGVPLGKKAVITARGIKYVDRKDYVADTDAPEELLAAKPKKGPRGGAKPRFTHDPKYVAAARELRDRYLEQINTERMLPAAWAAGKYDVSRQLEAARSELKPMPLLKAA